MNWHPVAFLSAIAALVGLSFWRLRSLKPLWAWNDVAIHLTVGGRLTEVLVPEIRSVAFAEGHLIFETPRGQLPIATRWVVPEIVTMLAEACGVPEAELHRALGSTSRTELWSGEAGSFRPPPRST